MLETPIFIAICVAIGAFAFNKLTNKSVSDIPVAKGNTWMGAGADYAKNPIRFLTEQRKKLGDVFLVDLFVFKVIFTLGSKNTAAILRGDEKVFSFMAAIDVLIPHITPFVGFTSSEGELWNSRSEKLIRTLSEPSKLDVFSESWIKIADRHFEEWSKRDEIDFFLSLSDLIFEAAFTSFIGDNVKDIKMKSERFRTFEALMTHPMCRIFPYWMTPQGRKFVKIDTEINEEIKAEARRRMSDPEKHKDRPDYLQQVVNNSNPDFIVCYGVHLSSLIMASHTNTLGTCGWTLLHAVQSGKWEKMREEVDRNEKSKGGIYPITELPYIEASTRETGRMYTNLMVPRKLLSEVTATSKSREFKIPAGSFIAASPVANGRDPECYPEPEKWTPERFLDSEKYKEWFRNHDFVQFGYGVHSCKGEKYLHRLLRGIIMPHFIANYDMQILNAEEGKGFDGVGFEADWSVNLGTPYRNGVRVKVTKRK